MNVFVITWRQWDGSGSGVVDVFYTKSSAEHMIKTLETYAHGKYELHEKEVIGYENNPST